MRRALELAVALLATPLLLSGCSTDSGTDAATDVATVAQLADELAGVADGCVLEYEGLTDGDREVSLCTLGTEAAELSVWSDPAALEAVVDQADGSGDPVVTGSNWSIDVSDPDLASQIAEATGGTVHS